MTIEQIDQEQRQLLEEVDELTKAGDKENRDLTEDESKSIDDKFGRIEKLKEQRSRLDRLAKARADIDDDPPERRAIKPEIRASEDASVRVESASRPRFGSLRAFHGAEEEAYKFGRLLHATFTGSVSSRAWCKENGVETRALSESDNTKGGVLVPSSTSNFIIDLQEQYGVFRQAARREPMESDYKEVVRKATGVTATWDGENTQATAQDMGFDAVELRAKKLRAYSLLSDELSEDSFVSIGDIVADDFAQAFAMAEDAAGFNGDGTSTYGGVVGIRTKLVDGSHAAGASDAETGDNTLPEVTAQGIVNMMAALPAYAAMNAKIYCSRQAFSAIFERLAITAGGNTVDTTSSKMALQYLGYPIVLSQVLPSSLTADYENVAMVLFGDISKSSTFGMRRDITISVNDSIRWDWDQIAIKAVERVSIVNHDLGDNTTAGPVVGLIGA